MPWSVLPTKQFSIGVLGAAQDWSFMFMTVPVLQPRQPEAEWNSQLASLNFWVQVVLASGVHCMPFWQTKQNGLESLVPQEPQLAGHWVRAVLSKANVRKAMRTLFIFLVCLFLIFYEIFWFILSILDFLDIF
jgi:hypothetical protein